VAPVMDIITTRPTGSFRGVTAEGR
jgi:hypothetical protein